MKPLRLILIGLAVITLTACNSYKVDVDLPADERTQLISQIKDFEDTVYEFKNLNEAPRTELLDLAIAYEELGELGKAIRLYEDVIKDGAISSVIYNNLGRLYEKVEDYDKAIEMYQKIIEVFYDQNYLYDITWVYIKTGDRKNAEKYFNAWQLAFQKTDEQTQQAIKKLRAQEQTTAKD